jgi:hypothetical protein
VAGHFATVRLALTQNASFLFGPVRKVVVGQEMVYWSELQGAKHSNTVGIASICNAADPFKRPFDGWQ